MNAREELQAELLRSWEESHELQGTVDWILNLHSHELAEKIRTHWYPKFPGKSEYTQGVDDGYAKAAMLIDPEVEK